MVAMCEYLRDIPSAEDVLHLQAHISGTVPEILLDRSQFDDALEVITKGQSKWY